MHGWIRLDSTWIRTLTVKIKEIIPVTCGKPLLSSPSCYNYRKLNRVDIAAQCKTQEIISKKH